MYQTGHTQTNFFDQPLIFVNLHQNAKNEVVFLNCSGETVDLKILQSDWLRAFWSISQGEKNYQIHDLCRNTANNINFHYRTNSVKINGQIAGQKDRQTLIS